MIASLEIRGFRCVQHAKASLSPLHAFIGPNDSGKTTILKAVAALDEACRQGHLSEGSELIAVLADKSVVATRPLSNKEPLTHHSGSSALWTANKGSAPQSIVDQVHPVHWVRFDPDELRRGSQLIEDRKPITLGPRGEGLAGVIDALQNRGDDTYARIRGDFVARFPSVAKLKLKTPTSSTKALAIELHDGTEVPAAGMSEGMLYWLAFAVLAEVAKPAVFLVEEPENGLHPARVAEVVAMLRTVTTGARSSQVLIATHSPLVVNALKQDEVTVVTRDAKTGTKLTPIAETPNFEKRSKVYALGELWLSYANGTDEAPLMESAE